MSALSQVPTTTRASAAARAAASGERSTIQRSGKAGRRHLGQVPVAGADVDEAAGADVTVDQGEPPAKRVARVVGHPGIVGVPGLLRGGAREIAVVVEAPERGGARHRIQVPEAARTALDHAVAVGRRARRALLARAERAWPRLAVARDAVVEAGAELPAHPPEIARHADAVADQLDAGVVVVGELHREALHPQVVPQRRGEDLEVEPEAVDRSQREESSRHVGAKGLEAALRIAKRQIEREAGQHRERAPGHQPQHAVAAVDLRLGELAGADRDVDVPARQRRQHRPQPLEIIRAIGVGEGDQGERAAAIPAATAAPLPRLTGSRSRRSGTGLVVRSTSADVPSVEPSSTTMISLVAARRGNASAACRSVADSRRRFVERGNDQRERRHRRHALVP